MEQAVYDSPRQLYTIKTEIQIKLMPRMACGDHGENLILVTHLNHSSNQEQ